MSKYLEKSIVALKGLILGQLGHVVFFVSLTLSTLNTKTRPFANSVGPVEMAQQFQNCQYSVIL